ncbi:hypothetical protein EXU57_05665 [Segetibacter sp. 3557_3]|uniref:DUF5996 family protein n=1 Tax=Segetibacter sp. 3557_3 TaxID=2547429 RepID=UPI001058E075|nr:DUF5996 family protein [Segetibacter sp. 3557_3]TDH27952.1 hypothetical protein EXU57_05665 [Segetibacter sp. 3557_3]
MTNHQASTKGKWPELNYPEWKDTLITVQLWMQIVGKIRLQQMPWINHSWNVTLYVSATGFTTGSMPFENGVFEISFDFIAHRLWIPSSDGADQFLALYPRSVSSFYHELFEKLAILGITTRIHQKPNEMETAIPFAQDQEHQSYDGEKIKNFWLAMVKVNNVFNVFRSRFKGKCSPVHLFWGAFDLAYTRFSGREAPLHQGGAPNMPLRVMQEAYSHEVSSCGFWPGNDAFPEAAFYAYCYPTPADYQHQPVQPEQAFYSPEMGEFFLTYEAVRSANNPEEVLLSFCQSTYEAAAKTGHWDRDSLDCDYAWLKENHPQVPEQ